MKGMNSKKNKVSSLSEERWERESPEFDEKSSRSVRDQLRQIVTGKIDLDSLDDLELKPNR